MAYTTVTDECPFIRFSGNTLEDVVVEKSKVKLELVGTTINVVFLSGGAQTLSWNEAQALEYGYTPTSLYSYILGILKVQCGGGGGGIDSVQAGTNIIIDNSDPSNPIINATFTQQGKYLISGGISWSGTGLVYDVSTLEYFFNGNKTSTATQVTLGASDPSNNRFDVVVVNEAGVVSVIQGTASSSPEIPPIPETEFMVSVILVEAGSVAPTILSEAIYLDDPTTDWTFSTYTTGPPTGTIIFNGTTTPKQGIHCIEANADQRLGARFVRSTSFDAYQYSMFSVWVRFTSAVAPNNALNVRFENSGGSLVGNTVNLFNFGLQRNIINTWQLVVIPLTSFGSLPSTVKGFRTIMTGGTIGVPRQWDIDYMHLTNGSIPYANVPTIAFQKDGVGVGSASTLNIKEGANMTITPSVNPISGAVEYEFEATSSGGGTPAGSDTQIQYNNGGAFGASVGLIFDESRWTFRAGDVELNANHTYFQSSDDDSTFYVNGLGGTMSSSITTPVFTGSGLDDIGIAGTFAGLSTINYSVSIDGINKDCVIFPTSSISGTGFQVGETITSTSGGSATIDAINLNSDNSYENLVLSSVTGTFLQFDVITGGTSSTTATIDSDLGQQDTFSWTDGTNSGANVTCKTPSATRISNDVFVNFDIGTGHTLSDQWTFDGIPENTTYGKMLNLDGAAGTMVIGDVDSVTDGTRLVVEPGNKNGITAFLGDADDTSFTVTDISTGNDILSVSTNNGNPEVLLGDTSSASITINSNAVGDIVATPFGGKFIIRDTNDFPSTQLFKIDTTTKEVGIGDFLAENYISIIDAADQVFVETRGTMSLGNSYGGNNTKIYIDDVNEQITISNLSAYDDDTAAGVGGLTAGMVYMTTGSGSAPLNAAGILMIKQ